MDGPRRAPFGTGSYIYIYIDIYTDCIIMQADGIVAHFQHFQAKHYPASKLSTSTTSTSIVLIIIFY